MLNLYIHGRHLGTLLAGSINIPAGYIVERIDRTSQGNVDVFMTPPPSGPPEGLTEAEKKCIYTGHHLIAIKSVRERTGCGLREAKQLCDDHRNAHAALVES